MESKERQLTLAAQGLVLASVAARHAHYSLSSVHRAVASERVAGTRIGKRLHVVWSDFRRYLGPVAEDLPETAIAAVEADHAR